jgi:hypothetical protein
LDQGRRHRDLATDHPTQRLAERILGDLVLHQEPVARDGGHHVEILVPPARQQEQDLRPTVHASSAN